MNDIILVDVKNNKFITNLLESDLDYLVAGEVISKNIYDLYYKFQFKYLIFNFTSLDNEILQFISEFYGSVKFFVFMDKEIAHNEQNLLDSIKKQVHILNPEYYTNKSVVDKDTILVPNNLVNSKTYYRNTKNENNKNICLFLDNIEELPPNVTEKLYPNSKLRIRMYNNAKINHYQNLGMVTEKDRAQILNNSEYFLNHNGFYSVEAAICGCKIIDINNLNFETFTTIDTENTITYNQFMKDNII